MQNFTFNNPVKILFGKGTIPKLGSEAAGAGKRALLVYGGGSVKKNGVYSAIASSLRASGVSFVEHPGVQPNPVLSHARAGIEKARENGCELVIAAGGGSVIDEAKTIAAGVGYDGDVWNFFCGKASIEDALPVFTVLTLPASGSEMNSGCVLTNEDTQQKFGAGSPLLYPRVSILDPETTLTLPAAQAANGAVDALAHLVEGYFSTTDKDADITDELVHAIARSVISSTGRILADPKDYDARASMMWSATLALNGLASVGYGGVCPANHVIEHSLSALYDIAHGAGLAIVMPAWFKHHLKHAGPERLEKFGRAVFGAGGAEAAIEAFEAWCREIGSPVRLSDAGISPSDIPKIAENAMSLMELWDLDYSKEDVEAILTAAR